MDHASLPFHTMSNPSPRELRTLVGDCIDLLHISGFGALFPNIWGKPLNEIGIVWKKKGRKEALRPS